MQQWGLPRDEFADTGHLPHQLYVREARRMVGEYVLTEHDLRGPVPGTTWSRWARTTWTCARCSAPGAGWPSTREPVGMVVTEGYLSVPVPPYPIPYRALVPRFGDCTNLLVPVCVSASHVAFTSVRMEPQYEMLGPAAGLAAVPRFGPGVRCRRWTSARCSSGYATRARY